MKKPNSIQLLAIILVTFVTACGQRIPVNARPTSVQMNLITTTVEMAKTKMATLTSTPQPATQTAIFPTGTATLLWTPTPTVTWTPISTIKPSERSKFVANLVRNPSCQLPCLWGITPGKTEWGKALQFLNSFGAEIKDNGIREYTENGTSHWSTTYYANFDPNIFAGASYDVIDGEIRIMFSNTYIRNNDPDFLISGILEKYGTPDKIFIYTAQSLPEPPLLFTLVLFYSDQRFFTSFEYPATNNGKVIRSCPSSVGPQIFAWSQEEEVSEEQINAWVLGYGSSHDLQMLEEVTELSKKSFMQLFTNERTRNCIETKIENWH